MENFEDLSKQYFNVRASKGNKISKIDIKKGRRIKESFNIDAHIVDAGCGENRFRNYFTNLTAFDFVDYGNQNYVCSILDAPIKKESQDGVLCLGVLHECPENYIMPNIKQMLSWLKPGGGLIMKCKSKATENKHPPGKNSYYLEYLTQGLWPDEKIYSVGKELNLELEWKDKIKKKRTTSSIWNEDIETDNTIFEGNLWMWRKNV